MNHQQQSDELRRELQSVLRDISSVRGGRRFDDIWQQKALLWQSLGWLKAQLKLWLRCQPMFAVQDANTDNPNYIAANVNNLLNQEDSRVTLGDAVASIVADAGGKLAIARLKSLLPRDLQVTDVMVKQAVAEHPKLKMMGPIIRFVD